MSKPKFHYYQGESQKRHLFEMVTIGMQQWGDRMYKIQLHGLSAKGDETPHIHIYLKDDAFKTRFNFEISLIDILSKDKINLMSQLDSERHIQRTSRKKCSWDGYDYILEGLKTYLFGAVQLPSYRSLCADNLDVAIYAWNTETDVLKMQNGGNPLKEWLDSHGVEVLPKYQLYFASKESKYDNPQDIHPEDCMSIEEAKRLTLEAVRKIYEQNDQ